MKIFNKRFHPTKLGGVIFLLIFVVLRVPEGIVLTSYLFQGLDRRALHSNASLLRNDDLFRTCLEKLQRVTESDNWHDYYVVPKFIEATESKNGVVTLCTQTSPHNLYNLVDLAEAWNGPISLSVFTYGHDVKQAIHSMIKYRKCNKHIEAHVTFHLVYSYFQHPVQNLSEILDTHVDCSDALYHNFENYSNFHKRDIMYSINMLRNIAMKYSSTQYIMMIDVDLVPSRNLCTQLQHIIKSNEINDKMALVLPSFESKHMGVIKFMDKKKLLKLVSNGTLRQFYVDHYDLAQNYTNYHRWLTLPLKENAEPAYSVRFKFPWEPFYVANRKNLPFYDERFKRFSFDRVSQICETYLKGFSFVVLNNAFLVHRGFKLSRDLPITKWEEESHYKPIYTKFKKEKAKKYNKPKSYC